MSISQSNKVAADVIADARKFGSASINELRQLNADLRKQIAEKQKELDQTLQDKLTLDNARKVQAEYDKLEAAKAKEKANDKTGISIVRNTLTKADLAEVQILAILNAEQTRKGLKSYSNYDDYLATYTDTPMTQPSTRISIVPATNNDPVTPLDKIVEASLDYAGRPLQAAGEVYLIVSSGYYVAWNRSRCYVQKQDSDAVNILVAGDRLYGELTTMAIIPNKRFRDLTRAEFDSIVKGKPAYNDLFKAFSKTQNFQNVQLNTRNAVPVW